MLDGRGRAVEYLGDMKLGVVGAGRIGGNCARQAIKAGHEAMLSFSRDPERLQALADELGDRASVGSPREAAEFGDLVIFSVPWDLIDEAIEQAGPLEGKIVVDTTNQFGQVSLPDAGQTAAQLNAGRMAGARYTKSFNTLTSGFQEDVADREGEERVVQWICGDDQEAKATLAGLIEEMGYVPIDLGGTAGCEVMEAPRREGAVYGQEYRRAEALEVVEAVEGDRPIPPTPDYS
jgi:8-hydroxy-5-deazaflavin:NADPH oxidoreductase